MPERVVAGMGGEGGAGSGPTADPAVITTTDCGASAPTTLSPGVSVAGLFRTRT